MINYASTLTQIFGFLIPTIIILFTFGNLIFSIGELSEQKSNFPKILLLTMFKIIIFVLLLDSILYNLNYKNTIVCSQIVLIGLYICYEAVKLNQVLFKVGKIFKLNLNPVTEKPFYQLNLNNIISGIWYTNNKAYWVISMSVISLIFLSNLVHILVEGELGVFQQAILIYVALLLYIKHKIMSAFKKDIKTQNKQKAQKINKAN